MNPRAGISILVCYISILSAYAQSERKDSLQQKKEGEIYINQEAVKSWIGFSYLGAGSLQAVRDISKARQKDKISIFFTGCPPPPRYQRRGN